MKKEQTKRASLNWTVPGTRSNGENKIRIDFDLSCSCGSRYCFVDEASASSFMSVGGKCLYCGGYWSKTQNEQRKNFVDHDE